MLWWLLNYCKGIQCTVVAMVILSVLHTENARWLPLLSKERCFFVAYFTKTEGLNITKSNSLLVYEPRVLNYLCIELFVNMQPKL